MFNNQVANAVGTDVLLKHHYFSLKFFSLRGVLGLPN